MFFKYTLDCLILQFSAFFLRFSLTDGKFNLFFPTAINFLVKTCFLETSNELDTIAESLFQNEHVLGQAMLLTLKIPAFLLRTDFLP